MRMPFLFCFAAGLIFFVAAQPLDAQQPRFFAISAALTDTTSSLIAYDANAQIINLWEFPERANPTFLASNGTHLFTNLFEGGSVIGRRAIDSMDAFEPFAALGPTINHQLEFDAAGNLYSGGMNSIRRFDLDGNLTLQVQIDGAPWGIDADARGNIYVADASHPEGHQERMYRYTPEGELDLVMDHPFDFPSALSIDELNERMYVTSQNGFLAIYDISSSAPTLLSTSEMIGIDLLLDAALDPLTGHLLVAGLGGVFEVDADGSFLLFNPDGHRAMQGVAAMVGTSGSGADFNGDAEYDVVDLDAMTRAVAGESVDLAFDLSGDGSVDRQDVDHWLRMAAGSNGDAIGYRPGDANLDGFVDALDFTIWEANKFQRLAAWSKGDFNTDGIIDGRDFVVWNESFQAGLAQGISPVPEPSSGWLTLALGAFLLRTRRAT